MNIINKTHDSALQSWVDSANDDSEFPIQNLPFCIFKRKNTNENARAGVAIGDYVIDMQALHESNLLSNDAQKACKALTQGTLNYFMSLGNELASTLRLALSKALTKDSPQKTIMESCLIVQADIEFKMPFHIGDYTDFYTSIYHATAVGKLFRPDQPLLPNYTWIPIAYHGRASSICLSSSLVNRPLGQIKPSTAESPELALTEKLDYEVELGIVVGKPTQQAKPVPLIQAQDHIFGVCLLNDWSARDIQAWEYQPLGPFLSKNFMSSVSPWVVTLEALAPYRTAMPKAAAQKSTLSYLHSQENNQKGAFDITLEAYIRTAKMRANGESAFRLSQTSFKHAYWTIAQMLTHHTLSGCNLNAGDLFGSGTQSGPHANEAGSLLELSNNGNNPILLPNSETRTFLCDGDEIEIRGFCKRGKGPKIGLGKVIATIDTSSASLSNKEKLGIQS